jgi:hypothetical protein
MLSTTDRVLAMHSQAYTAKIVQWIRGCYQIPRAVLKRPEELSVDQVAKDFGVSPSVVYYWIERHLIQARRINGRSPYWITLNASDEQKLRDRVRNSSRIQKGKASQNAAGESAL